MTEDLTAEAIVELPLIFKLAAERMPGRQALSIERTPTGIEVEVATNFGGRDYRVVTVSQDAEPSPSAEGSAGAYIYVDDRAEGLHSWKRKPSDEAWWVSFSAEHGNHVQVWVSGEVPPTELHLERTTIVQEMPAAYRP